MNPKITLQERSTESDGLELRERGRNADGETIYSDQRLFMQFLAFGGSHEHAKLAAALEAAAIPGALYADINDPHGVGLVTFSQTPDFFTDTLRSFLLDSPFSTLAFKQEYTMFGRTYSIGYEPDLETTLLTRPMSRVTDPKQPWAIWYPLRRSGKFEQLSAEEQRVILMEHGGIGRAYGRAGLGTDIRLACHGLDKHDNDFVIGLIGPELFPLSSIVQRMRKTRQTSEFLESLGPFFIGKALWQSQPPAASTGQSNHASPANESERA